MKLAIPTTRRVFDVSREQNTAMSTDALYVIPVLCDYMLFAVLPQVVFVRMALDASGSSLDLFLRQFTQADVEYAQELYRA